LLALCALGLLIVFFHAADIYGLGGRPWRGFWDATVLTTGPPYMTTTQTRPDGATTTAGIRTGDLIDLREQTLGARYAWIYELMATQPLLDLSVLANRAFSAANLLNFLAAFIVTGTLFVLPIYMQEFLRFSPTQAGTTMAPRAFVMMLVFPAVGWLYNRVPTRLLITTGLLLGLSSGVMMSRFSADAGWHDMILPQILQGVGAAFVLGPVATAALMSIPRERMAGAAAIESTTRLLGSTIGIAVFASLLTHFEASTWEIVRHNISLSSPVLYKRFQGLQGFFATFNGASALDKSFRLLNARTMLQVSSLAYKNLFQLIAAGFLAMIAISLLIDMRPARPHPSNPSHANKE